MQASRVVRIAATRAVRANEELVGKASPHLQKIWKSYTYTRNQRVQQLSPFEIDVLGPMFRNIGSKLRHRVEDNLTDVAPPLVFFVALIAFVKWKRQQILLHHRD